MKKTLYKIIYHPFINRILRNINKYLYPRFTKLRLHPSGCVRFRLNNGKTIKLCTNQTNCVSSYAFWNGIYEYDYLPIIEKAVPYCRSFLDIGANIGIFSVFAFAVNPNIKIIAFEPSPEAVKYLKKTLQYNNIENVIDIYDIAVSDTENLLSFYQIRNPKYPDVPNLSGSASLINPSVHTKTITVQTTSLDKFMNTYYPDLPIDFVKIDAEGAENSIIKGMENIIKIHKPIITCEILLDNPDSYVQELLKGLGYEFYLPIQNHKLIKTSNVEYNKEVDIRNSFYIPEEKKHIFADIIID